MKPVVSNIPPKKAMGRSSSYRLYLDSWNISYLDLFSWWFFTLHHGKSPSLTTIWENMFGTFSKHRRSKSKLSLNKKPHWFSPTPPCMDSLVATFHRPFFKTTVGFATHRQSQDEYIQLLDKKTGIERVLQGPVTSLSWPEKQNKTSFRGWWMFFVCELDCQHPKDLKSNPYRIEVKSRIKSVSVNHCRMRFFRLKNLEANCVFLGCCS